MNRRVNALPEPINKRCVAGSFSAYAVLHRARQTNQDRRKDFVIYVLLLQPAISFPRTRAGATRASACRYGTQNRKKNASSVAPKTQAFSRSRIKWALAARSQTATRTEANRLIVPTVLVVDQQRDGECFNQAVGWILPLLVPRAFYYYFNMNNTTIEQNPNKNIFCSV